MRIDGGEAENFMHQAQILMQMSPRDIHPDEQDFALREPDLILTFDIWSFERNKFIIEDLKRGDYIIFNSTITHLGVTKT